jgi:hypothetical protein
MLLLLVRDAACFSCPASQAADLEAAGSLHGPHTRYACCTVITGAVHGLLPIKQALNQEKTFCQGVQCYRTARYASHELLEASRACFNAKWDNYLFA